MTVVWVLSTCREGRGRQPFCVCVGSWGNWCLGSPLGMEGRTMPASPAARRWLSAFWLWAFRSCLGKMDRCMPLTGLSGKDTPLLSCLPSLGSLPLAVVPQPGQASPGCAFAFSELMACPCGADRQTGRPGGAGGVTCDINRQQCVHIEIFPKEVGASSFGKFCA